MAMGTLRQIRRRIRSIPASCHSERQRPSSEAQRSFAKESGGAGLGLHPRAGRTFSHNRGAQRGGAS